MSNKEQYDPPGKGFLGIGNVQLPGVVGCLWKIITNTNNLMIEWFGFYDFPEGISKANYLPGIFW